MPLAGPKVKGLDILGQVSLAQTEAENINIAQGPSFPPAPKPPAPAPPPPSPTTRTYSAAVERWRAPVAKVFPAELVDKALYVIQHESGGHPQIPGDGGRAFGLFQSHYTKSREPWSRYRTPGA